MSFLGDLVIRLKAETADFQQDLGKASRSAESSFKNISNAAKTTIGVLGGLSVAGAAMNFAHRTQQILETADSLSKLSERTGISTEMLSGFKVAADLSDVSQESLGTGLKKLAINMANANGGGKDQIRIFNALGISYKDAEGGLRKTDDVMRDVARKFAGMEDGAGKSALAVALFGKAGDQMIPLLNNLEKTEDAARKLGAVFGTDFSKRAEQFNDNIKMVKIAGDAFYIMIAEQMMPRLIAMSDEMVKAAENGDRLTGILKGLAQAAGWADPQAIKDQKEIMLLAARYQQITERIAETPVGGPTSGYLERARAELKDIALQQRMLSVKNDLANPAFKDARDLAANPALKSKAPQIDKRPDTSATEAAAEQKLYENALQNLVKQIAAVNGETHEMVMKYELTAGSLKKINAEHRPLLIAKAQELDLLQREIAMRKEILGGSQPLIEANQRGLDLVYEQRLANKAANDEEVFQLSLIGKTTDAVIALNIAHRAELDLREQLAKLPSDPEQAGYTEAIKRAEELSAMSANRAKDIQANSDKARAADREWVTGATRAWDTYYQLASNAALNAEMLFVNGFRNMEDALVAFVQTGKLDFKSLADSIIADLIRIEIRTKIMAPIAKGVSDSGGLGGLFGKLFGGGSADAFVSGKTTGMNWTGTAADFGGAFASGGRPPRGAMSMVGENGPELFVPDTAGTIIPNDALGGGSKGNVFYIDARGADKEGLATLAASIKQINGTIEKRAVAAVFNAQQRGSRA